MTTLTPRNQLTTFWMYQTLVKAADRAEKTAEVKNLIEEINIKSCESVNTIISIN